MSHKKLVSLTFEPYGVKSEVEKGTCLLVALKAVGLTVRSECGGRGICGKCKVIVKDSSSLTNVTEAERELPSSELRSGYRLACECSVIGDAIVYIPEESRVTTCKLLMEGTEPFGQ